MANMGVILKQSDEAWVGLTWCQGNADCSVGSTFKWVATSSPYSETIPRIPPNVMRVPKLECRIVELVSHMTEVGNTTIECGHRATLAVRFS